MVIQKQIQKMLDNVVDSYALIYKSRKGNWKVMWDLTDDEELEVKSIILSKLEKNKFTCQNE